MTQRLATALTTKYTDESVLNLDGWCSVYIFILGLLIMSKAEHDENLSVWRNLSGTSET